MKISRLPLLALAGALCAAPALQADEITDQIDLGKTNYEKGELRQAKQELEYAIAQIQELLDNEYTKLMPEPLAGWNAEPPQAQTASMAMMGGGTQISRSYRNDATGESVELQIMADSPFLQAMSMMLSNPMMMRSDPDMKMYKLGRDRGMIKHAAGSSEWEISLLVANRILVQANGRGLKDETAVEAYLQALNMQEVEKAFGL